MVTFLEARAAWARKYAREPAPWRAGDIPGLDVLAALHGPGTRALDVGAAGGKSTAAARALGWRVTPVDYVRASLPAEAVVADARALPFRDDAFDVALLVHVLGHLPAPVRSWAAGEAMRVARTTFAVVLGREDVRAASGEEDAAEPWTRVREGIPTHTFANGELEELFPGGAVQRHVVESRWGRRDVLWLLR